MDLIQQYRQLHDLGKFPGYTVCQYVDTIKTLIDETGAESILDYGSGKGLQYSNLGIHKEWGIEPKRYDPAVAGISDLPAGEFDGVISVDVLEHIPESEIDRTLDQIFGYARLFVFLTVCCRPAKKHLPDGRNCHLSIHPLRWWRHRIELAKRRADKVLILALEENA